MLLLNFLILCFIYSLSLSLSFFFPFFFFLTTLFCFPPAAGSYNNDNGNDGDSRNCSLLSLTSLYNKGLKRESESSILFELNNIGRNSDNPQSTSFHTCLKGYNDDVEE